MSAYPILPCPIPRCGGQLQIQNLSEAERIADDSGFPVDADQYFCGGCGRRIWIVAHIRGTRATYRDEIRQGLRLDRVFGEVEIEAILSEVAEDERVIALTGGGIDRPISSGDVLLEAWEQTKRIATPRVSAREGATE